MSEQTRQQQQSTALDDNRLIAERRAKLAQLREQGNAFPNDFRRTATAAELQRDYADAEKQALEEAAEVFSVCGRLIRNRGAFLLIQDEHSEIQLYVNRKVLSEQELAAIKTWDLGDIVAAVGPINRSGKGDLYINMEQARLLTKSLRPLPDKYHGLSDREMRYRRRYVDLIVNPASREVFRQRSQIVDSIRRFMQDRDFMEVETPMMQVIPGGGV